MKREVFGLRDWARAGNGEQRVSRMPGYMVVEERAGRVLRLLDLRSCGERVRLLGTGFRCTSTSTAAEGLTESGLPWHDDLYLYVLAAVDPSTWAVRAAEYIDQDELQAVLEAGLVTQKQVAASCDESDRVRAALLAGTFGPLQAGRARLAGNGLTQT